LGTGIGSASRNGQGQYRPRGALMPSRLLALALIIIFAATANAIQPPQPTSQSPSTATPPAFQNHAGDTAWMLTSTAFVLMMTIPGLALFYGGLVRTKNVLSVVMQCM